MPYPAGWAPLTRGLTTSCADLSATYRFAGDFRSRDNGGFRAYPIDDFFRPTVGNHSPDRSALEGATHARVTGPRNGELRVQIYGNEKLLEEHLLAAPQRFDCRLLGGAVTTEVRGQDNELHRSSDGALVARKDYSECIFVLIPICIHKTVWVRWPLLNPEDDRMMDRKGKR